MLYHYRNCSSSDIKPKLTLKGKKDWLFVSLTLVLIKKMNINFTFCSDCLQNGKPNLHEGASEDVAEEQRPRQNGKSVAKEGRGHFDQNVPIRILVFFLHETVDRIRANATHFSTKDYPTALFIHELISLRVNCSLMFGHTMLLQWQYIYRRLQRKNNHNNDNNNDDDDDENKTKKRHQQGVDAEVAIDNGSNGPNLVMPVLLGSFGEFQPSDAVSSTTFDISDDLCLGVWKNKDVATPTLPNYAEAVNLYMCMIPQNTLML